MLNTVPMTIPVTFITEIEKYTLKFLKGNTEQKEQLWGITVPNFKLYYRAIAIKTAWYWHKNIHEDQWNRIEEWDMNPHSYAHLIFDKGAKSIRWRKNNLFNKCCWENWISACRKLKTDPCLSPCTHINSKWIKDLKNQTWNLDAITGKSREHTGSNRHKQGLPL
jgi:hypothetical protein